MMGMPEANRTVRSRWPSACGHQPQPAVARPRTRKLELALVIAAVACEPSNTASKTVARPGASVAFPNGDGSRSQSAAAKAEPTPAATSTAPERPRVFAKSRFVWIRPVPDAKKDWIGFLWAGAAVELK